MKDRNLIIEPIWEGGLPMCHDNCEARCLKPESVIGSNGCYAWLRETGDFAPANPTVCIPAISEIKSQRDKMEAALMLAARWGISSDGYSSEVSSRIRCWIIGGMKGEAPKAPDYYPA